MVMEWLGGAADSTEALFGVGNGDASTVMASDPALQAGINPQDIANIDAGAPSVTHASSPFLSAWTGTALEPLMKSMAGMAMRPQAAPRAPMGGAGHGVSANAGSNGQVIGEIGKAAGGDPLNGLSGFKNLL